MGIIAIPAMFVPAVLSCSNNNLDNKKAIGVNGLQVLDDALGLLKLIDPTITSANKHTKGSMEQYKLKLELIIPKTKQPIEVEWVFDDFMNFNRFAQLISTNYVNGNKYKITFYKLQDKYYNEGHISYEELDTYLKDPSKLDLVGESALEISNFDAPLTFEKMKNLTTVNVQDGVNWKEQYVGGIKPHIGETPKK